ncbi:hypothetical protein LDL08_26620 [Nonomuraea glycinis]|uniref:Uncharacterized protein n=1 Tax=Nonomuraea glycinis TaxID=2047744 RepID=A0A918AEJ6_9ACTN|nr:hypothetical protein [Nonomuraea glycinis]MCA2179758.1 hypothetical protein [Nonomuraea glycinis]GGP16528.1 hypothetical protein GCM10012278_80680 [Nonomuraea glycinis]
MSPQLGINPTLMTQLINGMRRVSGTIPDVGRQVERALTSLDIQLWGPTALHGIGRQMSDQIPALQGRLDLILAEPDHELGKGGMLWASESDWLSKSPAEGAAAAKKLAARLRDKVGSHSLDAETVAEIERHKNDPFFALAFAKEVPPRELKALLARTYGSDLPPSQRPLQHDVALQERLGTMLSTLLGTASRGVGRMQLADDYPDRLVEDIENPQDAFAVKKLLQDGEFDHKFLLTVAQKLYDQDVAHPPDLSLPRDPWTMPGPKDITPGDLSPMGTALVALAHHPAVAQDFFTDPQRRPLAYLMRKHPWQGDADADLGRAIEVASTEFRDHDLPPGESRGYKSALIASWAVHFWSDPKAQANLPQTRAHLGKVLAQYTGDVHRDTRSFTEKTPGVVTGPDADKNLSGEEPYGAKFNAKDLQKVMTWAFESDDAFKTVAVAHAQYATKMLDELADKIALEVKTEFEAWRNSHPEATEQQLNAMRQEILEERMSRSEGAEFATATRSLSMTTWVITDAANIADITEAKQNDARFAMFKEITEKVVGLAPGPQGKFVGLLVDSAKGKIFGEIKSSHEQHARADADTAIGAAKHMFTDLTAAAMMRHGLFGDGTVPVETHPHHHKDFAPGSEGYFLADGKIIPWAEMNAEQREDYEEWLGLNTTGPVFSRPDESIAIGFKEAETSYTGRGS